MAYNACMKLSTLRSKLIDANLSRLALRSGVSLRTLRRMKNGTTDAKAGNVEKVAKALWGKK